MVGFSFGFKDDSLKISPIWNKRLIFSGALKTNIKERSNTMLDALSLIKEVVSVGTEIYNKAQVVKANKAQSQRLAERINIIIGTLQNLEDVKDSQHFRKALTDFKNTLKSCLDFINQFSQKRWIVRVLKAGNFQERFTELNNELRDSAQSLSTGFSVQQIMNREQDRDDQRQDLNALKTNQEKLMVLAKEGLRQQQKEQQLLQKIRLEHKERDAIFEQQLKSMCNKLERLGQEPVSKKPLIESQYNVDYFELEFNRCLAQGRFGPVYAGHWHETSVAIKTSKQTSHESLRELFIREAQVLSRLRHPNITQFLGACLEKETPCFIMESMENGTVHDLIGHHQLTPQMQKNIVLDIAQGLAFLHSQKIAHRDLNNRHVLLNRYNQAKLSGFGATKWHTDSLATVKQQQSQAIAYFSPEILQNNQTDLQAADIYSFGLMIWELLTNKFAFENFSDNLSLSQYVVSGGREKLPDAMPRFFKELIEACWAPDPQKRPSASKIVSLVEQYTPEVSLQLSPEEWFKKGIDYEREGDDKSAFGAYQKASEGGVIRAHTNWATFFMKGRGGVTVNKQRTKELLLKSAEGGHARAQHNLASMLANGDGIEKDIPQAIFWFDKAGEQGDKRAKEKADTLRQTQQFSYRDNLGATNNI